MELEKYEFGKLVGKGSYGEVYKAREKSTNRDIAVKLITKKPNPTERERKDQKNILKECKIHSSLRHPNIIQMLNSFETVEYVVVVTELADIDLHRFLSNNTLSEKQVQKLSWNLMSALHYLHSHRYLHRDLKPQNILLNNYRNVDEMVAKLCDFGLARQMNRDSYVLTSIKGTPLYMAPEVWYDAMYDQKADLWSVGCILYEANFGKPPIKTQSLSQLLPWLRNPIIVWPKSIDEDSKSFLDGLLRKEAGMRHSWNDILEHPYIKGNLLIIEHSKSERPLTEDLTKSQHIRKEKQKDEIKLLRGKKAIEAAMNKCQAMTKGKENQPDAKKKTTNIIADNASISSDDSICAIIQTDLETDVEGPLIKREKRVKPLKEIKPTVAAEQIVERAEAENQNMIIQRYTENFADNGECALGNHGENDNANLKIGTMLEMEKIQIEDENKWCAAKNKSKADSAPVESENQKTDHVAFDLTENVSDGDSSKDKITTGTENADDQSPLIENEEWLAFVHMSMQEIVNGDTDSLKQQNLVGIIVPILRNFNASHKVIGSIVQLLSIPFVLPISSADIDQIKTVYTQTKLLPNLIFASKIVCMNMSGNVNSSSCSSNFAALSSTQEHMTFKKVSALSVNQVKTLAAIYELVCYLIHMNTTFLMQFSDSLYIVADDLFRHLLSDVVFDAQGMQVVCAIISMLCYVLRETPENAELIESIIFHESVDIISLLQNGNIVLRCRLCNFLKMLGRFSCSSLQKAWTNELKHALGGLVDIGNAKVEEAAHDAIEELRQFPFYSM